jgi:hypothetical protein
MYFRSRIALGGVGVAVALIAFVTALEVQVSAMPATPAVNPPKIDRSLKSDRLPVVPATHPRQRSQEPRLPEGCVAATDWRRGEIYAVEIAGRCIA